MFFLSFLLAIDSNLADVYHPFDQSIQFQTRDFEIKQHNNDGSLYTMCVQKNESSQQCVLSYKEKPQPLRYEKVLKKAIPGVDGRRRVEKPSEWPHCVHGHLDMLFTTGLHAGSGILVGPHHFLTCAHNVFHNKEWAKGLTVYLGLDNETAPYGAVSAAGVYVYTNWLENENPDYDIALVVLKQSVGKKTGWAGMLCADTQSLAKKTVEITGYPADKSEGLKQMWTMSYTLESVSEERMTYLIDTFYGQSGGGICENILGNTYAVGIHTNGSTLIENNNSGVRLTTEKCTRIVTKWMQETGEVIQNSPALSIDYDKETIVKREDLDPNVPGLYTLYDAIRQGHTHIIEAAMKNKTPAWQSLEKTMAQKILDLSEEQIKYFYESVHNGLIGIEILINFAKKGNIHAGNAVGVCCYNGVGMEKNISLALQFFRAAASLGNIKAKDNLENLDQFKKLFEHIKEKADNNKEDPEIRRQLGGYYYNGIGTKQDYKAAFDLFKSAAEAGNGEAQNALGLCYLQGHGVDPSKDLAQVWWTKAWTTHYHREAYKNLQELQASLLHSYEDTANI